MTLPQTPPGGTESGMAAALDQAAQLVQRAKERDPLTRVTLVAPSHSSARDAYANVVRRLAKRGMGAVVNLHLATLSGLAHEYFVGSGAAAGRQELSAAARLGAVQHVLEADPGAFAYAKDEPVTAAALAAASAQLAAVATLPGTSERSGLTSLTRGVLRSEDSVREQLAPHWHGAEEALRYAADHAQDFLSTLGITAVLAPLGSVSTDELHLREALVAAGATVIQPQTTTVLERSTATDPGLSIVSVSDPDDEARLATRAVVRALDAGTPAHRIGVFWPHPAPYAELLLRQLTAARITVSSPAPHPLGADALVRSFTHLAGLNPEEPDERDLLDIRAQECLCWAGPVGLPSSRDLERHYGGNPHNAPFPPAFLEQLATLLRALRAANNWQAASAAALALLDACFAESPADHQDAGLNTVPRAAVREALAATLRSLASLDGLAPSPTIDAIVASIQDAADAQRLRLGQLGTGVVLGSQPDAVGRDLDLLILPGLAEGVSPARVREDPLLPDAAKTGALGGVLPTVAQRIQAQAEVFRAGLSSAPQVLISVPRGSLRGGGELQPSRWLDGVGPGREVTSWRAGFLGGAPWDLVDPVTGQEWRVRRTLSDPTTRPDAPADDALRLGGELRDGRRAGLFDRFHGKVPGDLVPDFERPLSASALESWVASPFIFFAERLLGVRLLEHPELELEADAAIKGTMAHQALEEYIKELAAHPQAGLDVLLRYAEDAFAEHGQPQWIPRLWEREKTALRDKLTDWWEREHAALAGWDRHTAEAGFGGSEDTAPPVEVALPDGSTVALSGKVDRVDWGPGVARVIDYKSGSPAKYAGISQEDPTAGGTRFQLPLYGLFALEEGKRQGLDLDSVTAGYDFLGPEGSDPQLVNINPEVRAHFAQELGAIMGAIRAGVFPPKVDPPAGFGPSWPRLTDLLGSAGQASERWQELLDDPDMASYRGIWQGKEGSK
ncbi:PD-(D/E)XK nuclease family protein [Galactobacter caseinivorans]|uniref:PD-(D/E)XK nuclease family protein n=1 Tax=Galactobacter caseinivorans TaxID=2676123 RepID=A0A496PHI6_9MICC|nr:PD-(D/E)XK nuclease family protein [Galactobacter caseinivorans]RKW69942.1 PD-(D/E)XK nuclease family protein [Galactobacter caseinivorans]